MKQERDPNGLDQHAPGAKLDDGKLRPALVLGSFARALHKVCEVGTYGARKYSDNGWLEVENGVQRYSDAELRHLLQEWMGEVVDPDTQIEHAAHHAWNALARLELMLRAVDKQAVNDIIKAAVQDTGNVVRIESAGTYVNLPQPGEFYALYYKGPQGSDVFLCWPSTTSRVVYEGVLRNIHMKHSREGNTVIKWTDDLWLSEIILRNSEGRHYLWKPSEGLQPIPAGSVIHVERVE